MNNTDFDQYTDPDLLAYFCERAAVREFDGKTDREHATVAAAVELRRIMGKLPAVVMDEVERVRS
jgi:predicted RNA-binding Zn ribbon-like protein